MPFEHHPLCTLFLLLQYLIKVFRALDASDDRCVLLKLHCFIAFGRCLWDPDDAF
jgi:hypothetical protein